jgi:hypothetical protein
MDRLAAELRDAERGPREMRLALTDALYGTAMEDMPWSHVLHDVHEVAKDRANALVSLAVAGGEIDRLRGLLAQAYPVVDRDLAEMIRQALELTTHEVGI